MKPFPTPWVAISFDKENRIKNPSRRKVQANLISIFLENSYLRMIEFKITFVCVSSTRNVSISQFLYPIDSYFCRRWETTEPFPMLPTKLNDKFFSGRFTFRRVSVFHSRLNIHRQICLLLRASNLQQKDVVNKYNIGSDRF